MYTNNQCAVISKVGTEHQDVLCKKWSKARLQHVGDFIHSGNQLNHENNKGQQFWYSMELHKKIRRTTVDYANNIALLSSSRDCVQ
jgi:hypothetical protein